MPMYGHISIVFKKWFYCKYFEEFIFILSYFLVLCTSTVTLLCTPLLFLHWCVKMSAVKRFCYPPLNIVGRFAAAVTTSVGRSEA